MSRLRTVTIGLTSVALAAGGLVASGLSTAANAAGSHHHKGVTIKSRHTSLGRFLVDSKGNTLYLFNKDNGTNKSACYHDCANDWPPLITNGKPHAKGKVKQRLLGTTKRKNGDKQVTYKGSPLYYFSEDTTPGDMKGEGIKEFGAEWTVISVKGKGIDND
ncbi:MAG: hypothetical protein JO246_18405 [Frankiaceae bacterium]|nr:hypothetical protein [Frankiaceae bacterium]MBV9869748.1 hypothetical protein [Frankiaceae bacterium]